MEASISPENTQGKVELTSCLKAKFEWSVDKMELDSLHSRSSISSPPFEILVCGKETKWIVSVHPRGVEALSSNAQEVYVGLHHKPGDMPGFETGHTVAFKRDNGYWPEDSLDSRREKVCKDSDWRKDGVFYTMLCLRDDLQKVYVDNVSMSDHKDTFIVRQKMVIVVHLRVEVPEDCRRRADQFVETMCRMSNHSDYSDVLLRCSGEVFKCHKVVLSARSDVLKAMLENKMKESRESEIEILDSSPDIVGLMIKHIYTGEIPNVEKLRQSAPDILHVAVKYNLVSLVSVCEESMLRELSPENGLNTFIYVDRYSPTSKLRDQVLKFLTKNAKDIVGCGDWSEFISSYPDLATEMFRCVVDNSGAPTQASQLSKRAKLQLNL